MPSPKNQINLDSTDGYDVWLPQRGESPQWHGRFWRYTLMGTERSLLGLYRLHRAEQQLHSPGSGQERTSRRLRVPSSWQAASVRYRWKERAAAWDAHQLQRDVQKWNERFDLYREEAWNLRQQLLERVHNMLRWPLSDQEVESQGADGAAQRIVIRGTGWKPSDLHKAIELVASLGQSAIGDVNAAIALLQSSGYRIVAEDIAAQGDAELMDLNELFGDEQSGD